MAGILLSLLNLRNQWTYTAMNLANLHNSLNLNGLVAMKRLVVQSGEFIYQNQHWPQNFFLEIEASSKVEILKQLKTFVNIDDWYLLFTR